MISSSKTIETLSWRRSLSYRCYSLDSKLMNEPMLWHEGRNLPPSFCDGRWMRQTLWRCLFVCTLVCNYQSGTGGASKSPSDQHQSSKTSLTGSNFAPKNMNLRLVLWDVVVNVLTTSKDDKINHLPNLLSNKERIICVQAIERPKKRTGRPPPNWRIMPKSAFVEAFPRNANDKRKSRYCPEQPFESTKAVARNRPCTLFSARPLVTPCHCSYIDGHSFVVGVIDIVIEKWNSWNKVFLIIYSHTVSAP